MKYSITVHIFQLRAFNTDKNDMTLSDDDLGNRLIFDILPREITTVYPQNTQYKITASLTRHNSKYEMRPKVLMIREVIFISEKKFTITTAFLSFRAGQVEEREYSCPYRSDRTNCSIRPTVPNYLLF